MEFLLLSLLLFLKFYVLFVVYSLCIISHPPVILKYVFFIVLLCLNMLINFRNEVVVWVERGWGEAITQTVVSTVSLLRIRKLATLGSCYTFCSSNNEPFLSLNELFRDELQYGKHMASLNTV